MQKGSLLKVDLHKDTHRKRNMEDARNVIRVFSRLKTCLRSFVDRMSSNTSKSLLWRGLLRKKGHCRVFQRYRFFSGMEDLQTIFFYRQYCFKRSTLEEEVFYGYETFRGFFMVMRPSECSLQIEYLQVFYGQETLRRGHPLNIF